jgi:hypothetical protein
VSTIKRLKDGVTMKGVKRIEELPGIMGQRLQAQGFGWFLPSHKNKAGITTEVYLPKDKWKELV